MNNQMSDLKFGLILCSMIFVIFVMLLHWVVS